MQKSELRQLILSSRKNDTNIDNLINQQLLLLVKELKPKIIAAYIPIKQEVNILPSMQYFWQQGINIYMPSVIGKKQPLVFKSWSPSTKLIHGAYGTLEPDNNANIINIHDMKNIDIMLVPSLGIFIQKSSIYRLGYGGGFYDITISAAKFYHASFKTASIYHEDSIFCDNNHTLTEYTNKYNMLSAEISRIKIEEHDIAMDMAITPHCIIE